MCKGQFRQIAKGRFILPTYSHVCRRSVLVSLYMSVPLPVSHTLRVCSLSVLSVHITCLFFCLSPFCPSVWPFVCLAPVCPQVYPVVSFFLFLSPCLLHLSHYLSSVSMSVPLSVPLSKVKTPVTLGLHLCPSVCSSLFLYFYWSVPLPVTFYLSVHLTVSLIADIYPSSSPFIRMLFVLRRSSCLTLFLSFRLSQCLYSCLSYCLYTCMSFCLSLYLYLCLSWASWNINKLTPRISLRWKGRKWFYYCCKLYWPFPL